jgi:hypothetical protein
MQSYLSDLARTEALALETAAQLNTSIETRSGDDALREALSTCVNARPLILLEQENTRALIEAAENETERDFRCYQFDLIKLQIERAAEAAEARLALFDSLKSEADYAREVEKCRNGVEGTIYWFEMYAWGFDPRDDSPLQVMPFYPFEFQRNYLRWLETLVFEKRTSGLVEKARDMGATVGALNWTVKQWLFRPYFSAMLASATEDLVDSKKDPDTLFEKVRFQLRLTPSWMLPKGFDLTRDMPYMNIANDESGAVISGTAPTANAGRQRRRTFVLADEYAAWPYGGYPQHTALSQTTRSMVKVSSVQGKHNKFSEERHSGHAQVFVMEWREHPWKDQRWYNALPFGYGGAPMSAEVIAQEVDRNYEASQPGKVFKQWQEEYVLITWQELIAYYNQFGLGSKFVDQDTGTHRVPEDWSWGRTQDYGQTEGHPWIISHMGRPRENYPLSDSVFIFSMHRVEPTGASPQEGRAQYRAIEESLRLKSEPDVSEMSHEASELRQTLMDEFGDYWEAWDTDYNLGIPQIQQWLTLVDTHTPNPFRAELMGRTRIYCVADKSEYQFVFDKKHARYFVTPSATDKGFKLFRKEMPSYHYPPEEMGKPVQKMRPLKILDDCIDTVRGFATKWGPSVNRMTKEEHRISRLPAALKPAEVLSHIGQPNFVELYLEQQHTMNRMKIAEEAEEKEAQKNWGSFFGRPAQHRKYRRR